MIKKGKEGSYRPKINICPYLTTVITAGKRQWKDYKKKMQKKKLSNNRKKKTL